MTLKRINRLGKRRIIRMTVAMPLVLVGVARGQPSHIGYQGELRRDGEPFHGTANAKFVILAADHATTLWSNDGTSQNGSEPSAFVILDVSDGVFGIRLGELPMQPLEGQILRERSAAFLRIWVDTGDGFEQLSDQPFSSSPFALACETVNEIGANSTDFIPKWNGTALVSGTIFDDGDVGIGTTNPVAKLDIAGGIAVNGEIVVNSQGRWVGAPGVGPPGAACWDLDADTFCDPGDDTNDDKACNSLDCRGPRGDQGTQGPAGPPPAHQWSGTSLRFRNPDGSWGSWVDLKGPIGPAVNTYCTSSSSGCDCENAALLTRVSGRPCHVTSDTGSCSAGGVGDTGYCCVCRPR